MRPLISCIVPVYNGEKYLAEAIESIVEQRYEPLEIIVADDGSNDGTADVAGLYAKNVCYLRQPNSGPAAARNLGLGVARGDFIGFLDADDRWHPEKLVLQMARFEAQPELDYCIGHVQNFWIPELVEEQTRFQNHRIAKNLPGYTTGTLLARRDFFNMVGPFDTAISHADDTDWFLRAKERGGVIALLPDVLLYRRLHFANRSRVKAATSRDQYLHIVKTALDHRRRDSKAKD
jgi:glycosyltransferase involved in cell wall biosynthesis